MQSKTNGTAVLLVDDEPNVVSSLERSLGRALKREGLTLHTAGSGRQAMERAAELGDDLAVLLTDQRMPEMSGSKLARELLREHEDLGIVVLSGYSDPTDMSDIVRAGALSFVPKPWELGTLMSAVQRAHSTYQRQREHRLANEHQSNEMHLAAEFHQLVMRVPDHNDERLAVTTTHRPAPGSTVSGDYFDMIKISDDRYLVAIGDVAGHGVQTAFLTAMMKAVIYPEYVQHHRSAIDVADITRWLNRRLCKMLRGNTDLFVTFSFVLLDLERNTMSVANAGQPPVLVVRDGKVRRTLQGDLALGVDPEASYASKHYQLQRGDKLMLVSDGLYPSGNDCGDLTPAAFAEALSAVADDLHNHEATIREIHRIMHTDAMEDDITLVTLEIAE